MARILSTSYVHVHVHTRTVNVCAMLMISYVILKYAPYDWLKCNPRLQEKKSRAGAGPLHVVSLFTAPFTARTSEACHRPMTRRRIGAACLAGRGRRFFFLQTRIAIPQYFSQSYGAYFKHIVRTCTCAYTYCKCLRDVILRHIKIRAIWLAEMQSSFAEKKIARGPAARGQSVHGSVYCAYKWGVSQTDDSPSLYRLNSMTNNVVSLFTAPFTVRTIVRRVTDQWLAIDKSTTSYPNEVFIIHAIRRGLDLKVRSTYCGKERETAIPLMYGRRAYHL